MISGGDSYKYGRPSRGVHRSGYCTLSFIIMPPSQNQKVTFEEVADSTADTNQPDHSDSDSDRKEEVIEGEILTSSNSQKKKKKKRSKGSKLLRAIRGDDSIPQELVNQVLDHVKADGALPSNEATEENVRAALEQLKVMDVIQGKAGLGGHNKKDMGAHKVCIIITVLNRSQRAQFLIVLGDPTRATAR